jgi:hypothetical protein
VKITDLNHQYTPQELKEINEKIVKFLVLIDENVDTERLFSLINEREVFIQSYLQSLSPPLQQNFASLELQVNNKLLEVAQSLLVTATKDFSGFKRSQAAVKKYK